jgi:hypothetical protein
LETVTISRDDALFRQVGKLKKRKDQLELDEAAFFADYANIQAEARERGVAFDLEMAAGLAASYSLWKQQNATTAARELSRADWNDRTAARAS